jgi:hypothetical protein
MTAPTRFGQSQGATVSCQALDCLPVNQLGLSDDMFEYQKPEPEFGTGCASEGALLWPKGQVHQVVSDRVPEYYIPIVHLSGAYTVP